MYLPSPGIAESSLGDRQLEFTPKLQAKTDSFDAGALLQKRVEYIDAQVVGSLHNFTHLVEKKTE